MFVSYGDIFIAFVSNCDRFITSQSDERQMCIYKQMEMCGSSLDGVKSFGGSRRHYFFGRSYLGDEQACFAAEKYF